jgi:hypothetical protein
MKAPNGWRYRQGRDLAGKTTRRRIRLLGLNRGSAAKGPHLSGARGVGQPACLPKRHPKKVTPPTRQVLHITYSLTILFNPATITTRQLR